MVIGVIWMSAHSLTSEDGIGSRSHDLAGEDFRILRMSSSDTKEDRAILSILGLAIETGAEDYIPALSFIVLLLKKMLKRIS